MRERNNTRTAKEDQEILDAYDAGLLMTHTEIGRLNTDNVDAIIKLGRKGKSAREISEVLGIAIHRAYYILHKHNTAHGDGFEFHYGRKKATKKSPVSHLKGKEHLDCDH